MHLEDLLHGWPLGRHQLPARFKEALKPFRRVRPKQGAESLGGNSSRQLRLPIAVHDATKEGWGTKDVGQRPLKARQKGARKEAAGEAHRPHLQDRVAGRVVLCAVGEGDGACGELVDNDSPGVDIRRGALGLLMGSEISDKELTSPSIPSIEMLSVQKAGQPPVRPAAPPPAPCNSFRAPLGLLLSSLPSATQGGEDRGQLLPP